MKYFNGFSLQNEEVLFQEYLHHSDYTVVGFSYGAQKAFEHVFHSTTRIDRLILLSPAFFQTQKPGFLRAQLRYFESGKIAYIKQFMQNVSYPSIQTLEKYLNIGTLEELHALLYYVWDKKKIEEVLARGTIIEVFVGSEDKILNSLETIHFFKDISTIYTIKKSGHLLER